MIGLVAIHASGYGGFNVAPGLPGVQGGPGSKPGYPVGTGKSFHNLFPYEMWIRDIEFTFFLFLQEWDLGSFHLVRVKLSSVVVYHTD